MPFWRNLFSKKDDQLPALLIQGLGRAWPELAFAHVKDDDAIDIRRREGGEQVLLMSMATVRSWAAEEGAAAAVASWLNDPQVRHGIDLASGRIDLPEPDAAGLVPRFTHASRLASIPDPPAHREAWPGVWLTVCWHHEQYGAHYLRPDQLEKLGLGWDEALARATDNLEQGCRGKLKMSAAAGPDGRPALIVVDDVHAAAGLLLPRFRERVGQQLGTPFLAMAPQTDELVAAPAQPRQRAEGYFDTARQSFRDSAHPVSDAVLVVEPGGFVVENG